MTDIEPVKSEYPNLEDLFKALDARLTGIETAQKETNIHLARMNGTVIELQRRSGLHSGKLDDHDGLVAQLVARLAVVERVTEIRDEHQAQGIRNAAGDAWEARVVAGDAVGWFRQAAVTAVMVLLLLLLAGGGLVLVLG